MLIAAGIGAANAVAGETALPVEVTPTASLQIDYRYHSFADDTAFERDAHVAAFDVRRARLGLDGKIGELYEAAVSVDLVGTPKMRDGYINYAFMDEMELRVGQFNSPFGSEAYGSSLHQEFVEDSTIASAISPGRDRGMMLHGLLFDEIWLYQIGLMNGAGDNTADNNNSVDVLLRTQVGTPPGSDDFLQGWVGLSLTFGAQVATEDTSIKLVTETASGTTYFKADIPEGEIYDRTRFGFNATVLFGPAMLKFEYDVMSLTFDESASTSGGSVMTSLFVTGEQRTVKNGVFGSQVVDWPVSADEFGAWELALRLSWFDVDELFFATDGLYDGWVAVDPVTYVADGFAWTFGVNWYPDENARIMFNWVNSYAPDPHAEDDTKTDIEQAVLMRFQLAF